MSQSCRQCRETFEVTDDDLAFLKAVSPVAAGVTHLISPPTLCPRCRLQRRLVFRNQMYVYQRSSSQSGKPIFSRFTESVPFPVVENDWWYGDGWDPMPAGRSVDFSSAFFPQIQAVRDRVPHRSLSLHQSSNCDYCNNATGIKNCYLTFNSTATEDCMYCETCNRANDLIDCSFCPGSSLCYDCTLCERCYNVQSSEFCEDCTDSSFLSHCYACKHCFGCINLSHKEFCAFNVQYDEAGYRKFLANFVGTSWKMRQQTRAHCQKLWATHPRPHRSVHNSDTVSGNHILNSKNTFDSYFVQECEDVRYGMGLYENVRSSRDFSFFGKNCELVYEGVQCGINDVHIAFCVDCWDANSDIYYSWMCHGCRHCFGCVGLRKKEYCILNKQYTKEEYEQLLPRVIALMKELGEWGEFFPVDASPTPYNHSIAQRYFPLTRTEAEARGCTWYDKHVEDAAQAIPASQLPDGLPATDDPIVVKSSLSGKPFRIIAQEIKRYRQLGVPLPRTAYDERMEARAKSLGGIRLYERKCAKTGKPLFTTYGPETPFPVWDREEYVQMVRG